MLSVYLPRIFTLLLAEADSLTVPGKNSASLEAPREHKQLIEANAIVKYLSTVGKNAWTADASEKLKENALIEFEETVLAQLVKTNAEEALKLAEGVVAKSGLDATQTPTPASIVLFSRLYNVATKAIKLADYPALDKWFKAALDTAWAKAAIEKVASLTTAKSSAPSEGGAKKVAKGTKKVVKAVEPEVKREYVTKLKEGIFKKIPEAGKHM